MNSIEIIKDISALEGTCYIELSLGKYQGKHWEDTSLFFDEEVFGYIEMIFERHIPNYDHYSMNDADSKSWSNIIIELKTFSELLISSNEFDDILSKVKFAFGDTRNYFQNNIQPNQLTQLHKMINELINWAEVKIKKHEYISVLGL